jgi:hypothetical protein
MGQNNSDYLATAVARNEPEVLDRKMTPTDIVEVLKRLIEHSILDPVGRQHVGRAKMRGSSARKNRKPCRTATPRSNRKARIWLMMPVRWLTSRSRTRCSACRSSCSAVFVATNFMVGQTASATHLKHSSAIARYSAAVFMGRCAPPARFAASSLSILAPTQQRNYEQPLAGRFRVAPFSAVLFLLISGQLGEGPVESALYRTSEVALGGAIAVAVSVFVFPERAHGLGVDAAARILGQLADALPKLLAGFTENLDNDEIRRIQDGIGDAVADFHALAVEAKRARQAH